MSENSEEAGLAAAIGLAVEQQVLDLVGKFFKGRGKIEAIGFGHQLQTMNQVLGRGAGAETAIEQGLGPVDDQFRGIEIVAAAQAVTFGAGSVGAVEREGARLQLWDADAAIGTRQARGVEGLVSIDHGDQNQAAAQLHGERDRHFQAMLDAGLHQQAVNDDLDGVVLALVEADVVFEIDAVRHRREPA